jgi:ketosteroid isomerase-like protein
MSRENVEIVRRVYEAAARRDTEAVMSLYDPEVEWDTSQHPMGQMSSRLGLTRGHEGLRAWFRDWYEVFEDFDHELQELIDTGEHVVSVGIDRGARPGQRARDRPADRRGLDDPRRKSRPGALVPDA